MKCNCKKLLKAINAFLAKEDNDLVEQLTKEGYLLAAASVGTINEIEELVTKLLEDNADDLLTKLNSSIDLKNFFEGNWPDIKKDGKLAQQLYDVFYEEFTTIMPSYIKVYVQRTDAELVVTTISKRTTDWIKGWSSELANLMKLDTNTQIETVLNSGLKDGKSITEIAAAIADSGIRSPGYRARRVALTEVLRAHGYSQLESYVQSPAVEKKIWQHTGPYRNTPRANHVAMDGTMVGKNEPFTLYGADGGTYHPMLPRDISLPASESVNCHCNLQPVVSADVLGLPLEERQRLQAEAIEEDDGAWMAELDAKNKAKAGIEEI